MALKCKKAKKTRELADRYTAVLAQRSTYTGNYKALQPTRTMKRLTNIVWAVLVFEWQASVECCFRSNESQMAAVASRYLLICLVKLSVGFVFGSASVQKAGRTPSLGLLPRRRFPPKTMYQVYLALFSGPNSVFLLC